MAWDRSSQSPRVGVRGQVTNQSSLHSHVTSCSPLIGQVLTINHAKFSDTGLYTCRGTAAAATPPSPTAKGPRPMQGLVFPNALGN